MADLTPLINGKSYEQADILVNILGTPFFGVSAIEYAEDGDVQNVYGAGRFPVSRVHGKITPSCKITFLMEEIQALRAIAPNGRLQDIPEFDVIVTFVDDSLIPVVHKIRNCRFKNNMMKAASGDVGIPNEYELVPSHIQWK